MQLKLLNVLGSTHVGVFFYDDQWRLTFANEVGLPRLENQSGSPIGRTITELNPSWEKGPFFAAVMQAAKDRVVLSSRAYSPRFDRWLETSTFPTTDGIAIYVADVDEEERAKQELANPLRRLRRKVDILNSSRNAVYVRELDGTVSYWSRGAETLYGWSAEETLGCKTREFLYQNLDDFNAAREHLMASGSWSGYLTQLTKAGRTFTADCRWQVALDDDGKTLHLCLKWTVRSSRTTCITTTPTCPSLQQAATPPERRLRRHSENRTANSSASPFSTSDLLAAVGKELPEEGR